MEKSAQNHQPLAGTIDEYLAALKASPRFGPQVVHHERFGRRKARFGALKRALPRELGAALAGLGVDRLYRHQTAAIDAVRAGHDIIVATPTASGKSLIYNLPVIEKIMADPEARALYLFPLKALAQDQLRAIHDLALGLPENLRPAAAICDGDTSAYRRKKLREHPPHILISNPDMLHLSLLGYHESWAGLWAGLTHVILDEVHTYRGVFGSHMAWVLRRLRRICGLYGAEPTFVLSSATVGNPGGLARDLLGIEAQVITETGAPQGARHFVFFDPLDSGSFAASQLLEAALKRGLRTIVYTQSRKMTELVSLWTQARLGPLRDKLTAYRAGFLPEERREIEARLASGELLGVVSTSALELGIDIGALDLCILVGYPGTIMQTWQRGGRVGRRQRDALIVLVGQEDALDQHFMRNPEDFFKRDVEAAVLNPDNRVIMRRHLLCAAAERPLDAAEALLAGETAREVVTEMENSGELLQGAAGGRWFTGRKYPHREIDLRGSGRSFAIRIAETDELLGAIDGVRCLKECHPGAVYLHRGRTWLVLDLDLDGHQVLVSRKNVHYFTRPLGSKETEILKIHRTVRLHNFRASFGSLRVTDRVTGFQRRLVKGQKLIATEPLDLPPMVFETEGLWVEIPAALQQRLEREQSHFMGGIHALEHGAIGIFPLLVLCDRNDVGGIAYPFHPQLNGPAVFIYDGYPGGVGLSRQAFDQVGDLLLLTRKTIASCPCEVGCPSCVHSPKCGSGNRPIDKAAALKVLDGLLETAPAAAGPRLRREPEAAGQRSAAALKGAGGAALPRKKEAWKTPGRYGVFDVETKRSAAEVGGWHRAEKMGISVAVLYDAGPDRYFTFLEHEIGGLVEHLQELDLVVGFNNLRFDNRVLSAYTAVNLQKLPTLDLLQEVRDRLGYRLSLDHLAEQTLGIQKTANGLMALKWYKEGRIDDIITYCRKDVEITRDLFLFGARNGFLLFKNKAGALVRCPVRYAAAQPSAGTGRRQQAGQEDFF